MKKLRITAVLLLASLAMNAQSISDWRRAFKSLPQRWDLIYGLAVSDTLFVQEIKFEDGSVQSTAGGGGGGSSDWGDLTNVPDDFSDGVDNVDDADPDPGNEIQALSISNDTVFLSGGGYVVLPPGFSGNYNDLANAPAITDDNFNINLNAPLQFTYNEQTVRTGNSVSGNGVNGDNLYFEAWDTDDSVYRTKMGLIPYTDPYVYLTAPVRLYKNSGSAYLTYDLGNTGNGIISTLAFDNTAARTYSFPDATGTVALTTDLFSGNPSDLAQQGAATGYVMKWNGSIWAPAPDATSGGAGTDAETFNGQLPSYYLNYGNLTNKPTYANVASTGSYNDLTNKPTLFSEDYNDLTNKPTLFSEDYNDLTNRPIIKTGSNHILSLAAGEDFRLRNAAGVDIFRAIGDAGILSLNGILSMKDPVTLSTGTQLLVFDQSNSYMRKRVVATEILSATATDVGNWNTAFGWGDHASAGYSSFTWDFDASDLALGTVPVARLPVGTGAGQVAAGNHTHSYTQADIAPAMRGVASARNLDEADLGWTLYNTTFTGIIALIDNMEPQVGESIAFRTFGSGNMKVDVSAVKVLDEDGIAIVGLAQIQVKDCLLTFVENVTVPVWKLTGNYQ